MQMINYTLAQLDAFLAVAETRSFRLASHKLNLSQSAVSTRIKQLESELGVRLFHRTTRSVLPTKQGEHLAATATRALADIRSAANALRGEAKLQTGRLVVASLPSAAEVLLPGLMEEFRKAHPGIAIELRDVPGDLATDYVLRGEADLGFFTTESMHRDIIFEKLLRDEILVVVPAHHPLAKHASVSLVEAAKHDTVGPSRGTALRRTMDAAFARNGLVFAPTQEAFTLLTTLRLVEAGFGIAYVSSLFSPKIDRSRCRLIRVNKGKFFRTFGLVTLRGRSLSPASQAFAELLRNRFSSPRAINRTT